MNKALLIGNLGRDPEIRTTQGGDKVATLSVATGESWTDKRSGERREKTEWHRVIVWGDGLVRTIEAHARKGGKVLVEGRVQTRKWDDKGTERYTTEVVVQGYGASFRLLGAKGEDEGGEG